jgi:hypothetical protein
LAGIADVQSDTLISADPDLFEVDEDQIDLDEGDSESLNYVTANNGALVFVNGDGDDLIGAFGTSNDVVSDDPADEGTVYYLEASSLRDIVDSGVDTLVFDLDDDGIADVDDPIVVAVLDRQDLAQVGGTFGAYLDATNYDSDNVYLDAGALVGLREIGVDTLAFDLADPTAASYLDLDTVELPYTNVDGNVIDLPNQPGADLFVDSVHEITAVDRYLTYNVTAVVDQADLEFLGSGFDSDFTDSTVYLDAEKLQAIAYLGVDNLALDDDLGGLDTDIVATLRDPEGFEALDWLMGESDQENLEILFHTLSALGVESLAIDWDAVSSDGFFGSTTYDDFQSAWGDLEPDNHPGHTDVSVVNLGVSDQY